MTLTQLRYVITIADTGSMNEASKHFYLAAKFVAGGQRAGDRDWSRVIQAKQPRVSVTQEGIEFSGIRKTSCRTI